MIVSMALILAGLVSGLISAWFWWRSSRTSLVIAMPPVIVTARGPAIVADDLAVYLQEVGSLNTKAAIWGAVAVACSTAAGIIGYVISA